MTRAFLIAHMQLQLEQRLGFQLLQCPKPRPVSLQTIMEWGCGLQIVVCIDH